TTDTTLLPHSGVVIWRSRELGRGHTGMALGAPRDGEDTWQHANDGWLNLRALENRRPACRSRCYARARAGPISSRSPATTLTASGTIMNRAAHSRRW